ncbi:MAG: protein kinase [Piscinibacter sp.]|nr:protein kinase [Piscinibacter sp.]
MKDVDPAHWRRLSAALDELLELEGEARAARLAQWRADDAALADELAKLLELQDRIDREQFLEGSAMPLEEPTLAGQTLGAYTIERPLGAGGMGSVWLARRSDGRYEGLVAFKLLNLALLGRGGAERFAREGSALARLAHPNIARLLDAGVTDTGQPYLVLEHVDGEPIDRWCEARALDVPARVRLMLDVLAAVAHAHSKLVLHRDLKPGNILVTPEGRVKLLDFGIAKLIDDEAQAAPATEITQLAGRAFTPDFAAPEQIEGGDVTTATDVYALGVLLYMLLAGVHPTAKSTDTPAQRLRSVVDTEPARLSTAASRATALLRGDLDNICAKALKKVPAERYATADALADDLRRYLAHEPVSARPDSLAYRSAKFVRRHRVGVAAAALVVLALAAGVVGTTWQAVEAQRQRAQALHERDRAQALAGRNEAIVNFVDLMFTEAVPSGQGEVLLKMLERSEGLIVSAFGKDPVQQAEILRVLGGYYVTLNLPNKQAELLERARGIVAQVPDRSLQARLACEHANALSLLGRSAESARILDHWIAEPDIEPGVAASCLQLRAILAQTMSDAAAALRHAEAGLARVREAQPPLPLLEATLFGDVAFAHRLAGRNAEADGAYRTALERLQAIGRGESSEAGRMLIGWGLVRYAMSDFAGGLEKFQQVLDNFQRRGDPLQPPGIVGNQAFGLEQLGRYPEALATYGRSLDAAQRIGFVAGQAFALVGQASVQAALGQADAAQRSLAEAAPLLQKLPPAHSARIRHTLVQARLELQGGRFAAAQAHCAGVIELLSAKGAESPALASAHRLRAEAAWHAGARAPALADAEQALALAQRLQGSNPHSDLTGQAWLTLGRVLSDGGDAARAREALGHARDELQATVGAAHPDTRTAEELLARR